MVIFVIFIIAVIAYVAWMTFAYLNDEFPFTPFQPNIPTGGCDVMGPVTKLTPDQQDARKKLALNVKQDTDNTQTLVPLPGIKC